MCGWYFTGMPFMWMGGSFGIFGLIILLAVGAYYLGTRSKHKE
ncbi:hypothetical protein D1831_06255 [Lactiplantibacillus garii]|uniref:Uncharacterized protein n=2 Tax=Lactiplantibacillus garii TaxID=2306423 RepID=A0A426D7X2_9LACO|nr:hypothetical protein D1831_06255 [Lactiplantibacillus garii]